ncbi:MAG: ABC transporter permease subunit [Phycisphaeraceae bacterium]|nr:MAG: ABC transporter permease subunit [Phycisphaeraceae bacterium]
MWTAIAEQLELLPEYLGAHILLTLIAMGAGIALSIPLALLVIRVRPLQGPALAAASVIQTIPSLALLALMVPLLGQIGRVPAVIALTAYSVLPILRNTVTGIMGVDAAIIEAARGVGMRPSQILLKVQLPLASPVIIAGVRTATVWVVGIATLSTPVGATSLGNYIFSGLQTQNHVAVLVGCFAAAILAISLDLLIRLGEIAAVRRSKRLGLAAGLGVAIIFGAGLAPLVMDRLSRDDRPRVTIGAKTFTEQYILSRVMAAKLEEAGYATRRRDSLGSMVIFDALRIGEIDCYIDYSGTIWFNSMNREDIPDAQTVLDEMGEWLMETHGITSLGSMGFENAYVFAMRRDRADELGVTSVEDLAGVSHTLRVGGDYEFFDRPDWRSVRDAYDLQFRERVQLDSALMYSAVRENQVDVIAAFSTDARIEAFDLVLLDDPRGAFPPYDAVILLSPRAGRDEALADALRPLLGAIDNDAMRRANTIVDVDGEGQAAAAGWLVGEAGRRMGGAQ